MNRRLRVWPIFLISIIGFLDFAQYSHAQPHSESSIQAASDEADHLDKLVVRLPGKGKFQEAVPLAQQSLALRETLRQLADTNTELSTRLLAPSDSHDGANRSAATTLRTRSDNLESTLNTASAEFRVQSALVPEYILCWLLFGREEHWGVAQGSMRAHPSGFVA
jgi:hypothetical protein